MNPITEIQQSIRKELTHEKDDFKTFSALVSPVLNFLSRDIQKGKFSRDQLARLYEITSTRSNIDELEKELEELSKKALGLNQNSSEIELLEAEKSFKALKGKITDSKIKVLSELFRLGHSNEDMASRIVHYQRIGSTNQSQIAQIEAHIKNIYEMKQKILETMTARNSLMKNMSAVLERINKIKNYLLDKHEIQLSKELMTESTELEKLKKAVGGTKTVAELEKLQAHYYDRLQKYEIGIMNVIFEKRNDPLIHGMLESLSQDISWLQDQIDSARPNQSSSPNSRLVTGLLAEFSMGKVGVDTHKQWQNKLWARLLIPKDVKEQLGIGFRNTIDSLTKEKKELQSKLADPNCSNKAELEKQLIDTRRALYHTMLTRLIDVIGDKEWERSQLIENKEHSNSEALRGLESDIDILNKKFASLIKKYQELPVESRSLLEAWVAEKKQETLRLISLGYYTGKTNTYEEFLSKKHYADMGYSMERYITRWLKGIQIPPNQSVMDYLQVEFMSFFSWAKKHPIRAARMASDMALTVNIIGGSDTSFLGNFRKQMETQAYAYAFLAPFGGPDWEQVEEKEELKYRALADLARYAPVLVGAGVGAANQITSGNPLSILQGIFSGAAEALMSQTTANLVPTNSAEIVGVVAKLIQGDGFKEVLETQRNVELTRIGGIVQSLALNPTDFIEIIQKRFRLWRETIAESKGLEKFTRIAVQVAIPAASFIAAVGVVAAVIAGGPITWALALTVAVAAIGFGVSVIWRSNTVLNTLFPNTTTKVLNREKIRAKEIAKAELLTRHEKKVAAARDNYTRDLQAARIIPYIKPPQITLDPTQQTESKEIVENMTKQLIAQLEKNLSPNKDPIDLMKRVVDVEQLLNQANELIQEKTSLKMRLSDQENLAGFIAYQVTQEIIESWLKPKIQEKMVEDALLKAHSMTTSELEELKTPKNEKKFRANVAGKINEYLAEKMENKYDPDESRQASDEFTKVWEANFVKLSRETSPAA